MFLKEVSYQAMLTNAALIQSKIEKVVGGGGGRLILWNIITIRVVTGAVRFGEKYKYTQPTNL